jgi:pyruvate dehydrogenase E1 component alpha subunit
MSVTIDRDILLAMLQRMLAIRGFEQQAEEFVDRGEMLGGFHSSIGQEATSVGGCMALRPDDYMTGTHRSHGHPIAKGADLKGLAAELLGKATGVCRGKGGSMHLADFSVGSLGESSIVGSSLPIAAGAGLAIKLRGEDRVCIAFFGDGAANTGAFHEALNLSAIDDLPVIFLCENNSYAITTPARKVTSVAQIADRAPAYGMHGEVVDGQDVLAVFEAVSKAADRARAGRGPSLVEAMTYRYGAHSYRGADAQRPDGEMEQWEARDPIDSFKRTLLSDGRFTHRDLAETASAVNAAIEEAAAFARASSYPEIEEIWQDMYADSSPWDGAAFERDRSDVAG